MAAVFKAGRVPGRLVDFVIEDDKFVRDALALAGLEITAGEVVSLDGTEVSAEAFGSTKVEDGSTIVVAKQVKGN